MNAELWTQTATLTSFQFPICSDNCHIYLNIIRLLHNLSLSVSVSGSLKSKLQVPHTDENTFKSIQNALHKIEQTSSPTNSVFVLMNMIHFAHYNT